MKRAKVSSQPHQENGHHRRKHWSNMIECCSRRNMIIAFVFVGSVSSCQGFLTRGTLKIPCGISNFNHLQGLKHYPENPVSSFIFHGISEQKPQHRLISGRDFVLFVATDPARDTAGQGTSAPKTNLHVTSGNSNNKNQYRRIKNQNNRKQRRSSNKIKSSSSGKDDKNSFEARWQAAIDVEERINVGLDQMRSDYTRSIAMLFPSVRECNAALATFGDRGELLRALRLFAKMRKAAYLAQFAQEKYNTLWLVPAPTLVTYSTLMSRAVSAGKPLVAVRLWLLMKNQAGFRLQKPKVTPIAGITSEVIIVPDVKAANILMNAYAKLADVRKAEDLLCQMLTGNGDDVPATTPNLVTYNTFLDACHKAQDLNKALEAKELLLQNGITPDARTYTTLIATVARKNDNRYGAKDPTLAFSLLREMHDKHVRPNGKTYCALIDVCGRCKRSDLAINGLLIMLRQKQKEEAELKSGTQQLEEQQYSLSNEVGAWTAAIDACGKAGRIETAVKLFNSMANFGVEPNTITCGCLTDCLLRNGKVSDTLDVLQYMEYQGIAPSEFMYTSLMTSAGKLVELENKKMWQYERRLREQKTKATTTIDEQDMKRANSTEIGLTTNYGEDKAIKVYTELMKSLMRGTPRRTTAHVGSSSKEVPQKHTTKWISKGDEEESTTLLFKVFLIYQEMTAAGAKPDIACYNALLRACARAGDINRAQDVMDQIRSNDLDPNDRSWREMIRTAGKARRSDVAESIWESALDYRGSNDEHKQPVRWKPSVESFGALVSAYIRHAASFDPQKDKLQRLRMYEKVVSMYEDILEGNEKMGADLIDGNKLHENKRTMLLVLRAVVLLENAFYSTGDLEKQALMRDTGKSIVSLECLYEGFMSRDRATQKALKIASSW